MILGRKTIVMMATVGLLCACDKGSEQTKKDDDPAGKDKPAATAASGETTAASAPEQSPDKMAFFLGRKWGFACTFAMLDKADAVSKNMGEVTTFAKGLGINPPTAPTKDGAIEAMRSPTLYDEIKKKHGDKTAAAFSVGVAVTDAYFGANLDSDIATQLAAVEKGAKDAGIPETVYKSKLDAVKAKPDDEDAVEALADAFEGHYRG